MGEINFKIDMSFAYLLFCLLDKDKNSSQLALLNQAADATFAQIISRNFKTYPQAPQILIYKENDLDKEVKD